MVDAFRVGTPVTQASHGFTRGGCVVFDGTNWVVATIGGPGVGVVGDLLDGNTFQFVQLGELTGLSGLTPGSLYYTDGAGNLSTTPNGPPIGKAYSDTTLFVVPAGEIAGGVDLTNYITATVLAAAIAAEVVRADATYAPIVHNHDHRYIHSVQHDGVISVDIDAPGPIFDASDGTQVLVDT